MSWKEKKDELINRLPTIIDILEEISLGEEIWNLEDGPLRMCFPNHYQEGMFDFVAMPDGTSQLWPISIGVNNYYRGQSSYYPKCYPSLYRPGMTDVNRFVARLRTCELQILMEQYPLWDIFNHGTMVTMPDGSQHPVILSCDELALAQHYGLPTELLDLTVDKWVAAFFACTKYDSKTDTYRPTDEGDGYGVFYSYSDVPDVDSITDYTKKKLRAVGLQPFARPGEQAGYVLKMEEGQNFTRMSWRKIKFRHDRKASELVFNYTNRAKKLFPKSPLEMKAAIIKETNDISFAAFDMAQSIYFSDVSEKTLEQWLDDSNIRLVEKPIVSFSDGEKEEFYQEWKRNEKRFYSQINVRFTLELDKKEV